MTSKNNCVLSGALIFFQAKVSLLLNLPCNTAYLGSGSVGKTGKVTRGRGAICRWEEHVSRVWKVTPLAWESVGF